MGFRRESIAEYWDVYDGNRELTGKTIKRGESFGENEFYVCCEVNEELGVCLDEAELEKI